MLCQVTIKKGACIDWSELLLSLGKLKDGQYILDALDHDAKTARQMRYLRGVLYPLLMDHTGYSNHRVNMLMKGEFMIPEYVVVKGKEIPMYPSLADSKKNVVSKFIQDVFEFCDDMGLDPPVPDKELL